MSSKRLDLDNYVPALITFVSNKVSKGASATYRKHFGVGITDWRTMSMLAVEPNIPASRISEVRGIDKAAISRTLKSLKERDLVVYPTENGSLRHQAIALTDKGKKLHDEIIMVALAREQALLSGFTKEETMFFISLLHKLHGNIKKANAVDADSKDDLMSFLESKHDV